MKNSKLKEYLNSYPDNADIAVVIVAPKKKQSYELKEIGLVTGIKKPALCLEIEEHG